MEKIKITQKEINELYDITEDKDEKAEETKPEYEEIVKSMSFEEYTEKKDEEEVIEN